MAGGSVGIDEFIKYGFPALSVQQVKKGAKWNAAFQRTQLEGSIHVTAKMEEVYRLAGYETVDDLACVKIESQIKGILNGSESQYGSQWTYTGKLKGKATWYFSYEEGLLVKLISNETTEGTISTQGENAVSVPTKQKTKVEIRLRR